MNRSAPSHLRPHRQSNLRRVGSMLLGAGLLAATVVAGLPAAASASTVCDPAGDVCVVYPDSVQTPLGLVTVTASSANVVTVHLEPTSPNTLVVGVPFTVPARWLLGCPGGCTRTTIDTSGGLVTIDTFAFPPGPPTRIALPSLAFVSIHPPGPCRASTSGTTVTFTPIQTPPGPPN